MFSLLAVHGLYQFQMCNKVCVIESTDKSWLHQREVKSRQKATFTKFRRWYKGRQKSTLLLYCRKPRKTPKWSCSTHKDTIGLCVPKKIGKYFSIVKIQFLIDYKYTVLGMLLFNIFFYCTHIVYFNVFMFFCEGAQSKWEISIWLHQGNIKERMTFWLMRDVYSHVCETWPFVLMICFQMSRGPDH